MNQGSVNFVNLQRQHLYSFTESILTYIQHHALQNLNLNYANLNHFFLDHRVQIKEKLSLMCFRLQQIQHSVNITSEREGIKVYI